VLAEVICEGVLCWRILSAAALTSLSDPAAANSDLKNLSATRVSALVG